MHMLRNRRAPDSNEGSAFDAKGKKRVVYTVSFSRSIEIFMSDSTFASRQEFRARRKFQEAGERGG